MLGHFFTVERVGQLDQDTCAVTHEFVGTDRTTVVDVFENLEGLRHDVVALFALDVGDKAQTACIVLVGRRIQAVIFQVFDFGSRGHGALLMFSQGMGA